MGACSKDVAHAISIQPTKRSEMRSKHIAESPKTYAFILDTGDEILSSLRILLMRNI